MMERTGDLGWAIAGVNLRSAQSGDIARLGSGGGTYVVKSYDPDGGTEFRLVRAHKEFFDWSQRAGSGRGHRRRCRSAGALAYGHRERLLPGRRRRARPRQPRDPGRAGRHREELDLRLSPGRARQAPCGGGPAPHRSVLRQPARERHDAGTESRYLSGRGRRAGAGLLDRRPRIVPLLDGGPDHAAPGRASRETRWPSGSASATTSRSTASASGSG